MNSVISFMHDDLIIQGGTYVSGVDFNLPEHRRLLIDRLSQNEINTLNRHKTKVVMDDNPANPAGAMAWTQAGQNLIMINVHHLKQWEQVGNLEAALVEVIAHECKHLEQYNSGRLVMDEQMNVTFEGRYYKAVMPSVTKEYLTQPWEKEAVLAGYQAVVDQGLHHSVEEMWNNLLENTEDNQAVA